MIARKVPLPVNRKQLLIPAVIVAVAAIGAGSFYLQGQRGDKAAPGAAKPAASAPAALPAGPTFDVVRVEPAGNAVIAGRATPGQNVRILDGDKLLGAVTADARGEWVFLPPDPLSPGARELRLEAVGPDGTVTAGLGTVVLAVPESNRDLAGRRQDGTGDALAVLTGPQGDSRVLQKPRGAGGDGAPRPAGEVTIDTIDYDRGGRVTVGGQAKAGSEVMLYVENNLIGRIQADDAGRWSLTPDRGLENGRYSLRADQVLNGAKVASRAEVEFDKKPLPENMAGNRAVVVVPGNNLWTIARRSYGEGPRYTMIFEANQGQIRDPDLIYPGQIFMMPDNK
ncbi:Nucleoid-associated protein YgaU, contains BON and LysM domains [Azospirillum sp. RU38E]|nr:Nucleoid-associated protein YgaU, contains BON and LysM domains [Azospirillum sp. RU38E]SNT12710.1 Nucleoid-associated protein YgaU, contains BON and LysM domains [Azospirillum sp. RU37A]